MIVGYEVLSADGKRLALVKDKPSIVPIVQDLTPEENTALLSSGKVRYITERELADLK